MFGNKLTKQEKIKNKVHNLVAKFGSKLNKLLDKIDYQTYIECFDCLLYKSSVDNGIIVTSDNNYKRQLRNFAFTALYENMTTKDKGGKNVWSDLETVLFMNEIIDAVVYREIDKCAEDMDYIKSKLSEMFNIPESSVLSTMSIFVRNYIKEYEKLLSESETSEDYADNKTDILRFIEIEEVLLYLYKYNIEKFQSDVENKKLSEELIEIAKDTLNLN